MQIHSNHADKVCSLFNKSDCNDVLESPASKFMGLIGWSELGLGYFISNVLIILFLPQLIYYSALINICALPYSFWSIWYQKVKAKQWCSLCLIVQALLWAVFIVNLFFGFIQFPFFEIVDILVTACVYLLPFLSINFLLTRLSDNEKIERTTQEMNSLKMNDEVISVLFKQQAHYQVSKNTSNILFGNKEANMLITILTNPHCTPCASMHKRIIKLLEEVGDKICIQYIFSSFNEDLSDSNRFLISAYFNITDTKQVAEIYDNWFDKGKFEKDNFFQKYNLNYKQKHIEDEFLLHEKWKRETKLNTTPIVLINGIELPNNYKIEDLKYFTNLVINAQ